MATPSFRKKPRTSELLHQFVGDVLAEAAACVQCAAPPQRIRALSGVASGAEW